MEALCTHCLQWSCRRLSHVAAVPDGTEGIPATVMHIVVEMQAELGSMQLNTEI